MNTEIANAVNAASDMAQYDERAKRLLSHKSILAHILVDTVEEFRGMDAKNVEQYIEGQPRIGKVSTEPGLTNMNVAGERLVGMNTENTEINEGTIKFDIVFYVRMKNGLSQIIVNVEAQKDAPTEYHILNRAIFYVCRLVSSQKEREFINKKYDDIKQVYTIWICMNMPEDSTDYYYLTNKKALGNCQWKGKQDILNIVLIGLAKELSKQDENHELHRLLGTLLSKKLTQYEKLNIIEKEYNIPIEEDLRKDVSIMCNLSQGIVDDTKAGIIMNMYKKGYTLEQIADITEKSISEIEKIIDKKSIIK
ncbi:hypothetical protein [Eubacterium sp.]